MVESIIRSKERKNIKFRKKNSKSVIRSAKCARPSQEQYFVFFVAMFVFYKLLALFLNRGLRLKNSPRIIFVLL